MSVKPEVQTIRANGRRDTHPNEERMLTARRRDTVREEKAGIGKTGQSQRMLAVEALHFIEAPGGSGRGR